MGETKLPTGVESRGDHYRIWFIWEGRRCREPVPNFPHTPAGAAQAGRLRSEIAHKIKLGVFDSKEYLRLFPNTSNVFRAKEGQTFGEIAQRWLDLIEVSEATRNEYKKNLNRYWMPRLAPRDVSDVKRSEIRQIIKEADFPSAKTRNNALTPVRGVFALAVDDELCAINPCDGIKNTKHQKEPPDPFSEKERETILAHFHEHEHPIWYAYFSLAFFSGLRSPSEITGLLWDSVDLNAGYVRVERKMALAKVVDQTKTAVIRDVILPKEAMAALKTMKAYTYLKHDHVFVHPETGEALRYQKAINRVWRKIMKKTGIRYREPYNCRHTCATQWIMAGANPVFVAKQLGHSVQMTLTVYSKWINSQGDADQMTIIQGPNAPKMSQL
jgi:integrase